jgi:N-acetylglucosaminyl-diphospho-decaprenol L-rhamnosyltransferase
MNFMINGVELNDINASSISVIMVSYMTGPALFEAIKHVILDTKISELIIIDNGNPEQVREKLFLLVKSYGHIKVKTGHGNIGFSKGCNYGAKVASGNYLLFLNPDALITKNSATKLMNLGKNLKRPWITGGKLINSRGEEQRGSRRGEVTLFSSLLTVLHLGKKTIHQENNPLPNGAIPCSAVSGALLMIDKSSFQIINGFDEDFFLHVEDLDICKRAIKKGGDVYFLPNATAMHYGATSDIKKIKVELQKLNGFKKYFIKHRKYKLEIILIYISLPFMALYFLYKATFSSDKKI